MPVLPSPPLRVALVGAGRVGTAVTHLLQAAGNEVVGVASRSEASASRAAELLEAPVVDRRALPGCDVIVIGAAGTAISLIFDEVAPQAEGTAVIHLAGAVGTTVLWDAEERGVVPLALHPVQACPTAEIAIRRLPGSAWGVTCAPAVRPWAHELVRSIGGSPYDVREADRPLWHAASVMTSNGIAALLGLGELLLGDIEVSEPTAVLAPIAAGTVQNAIEGGGGAATLTGPVVRGETGTIERHLLALAERSHELQVGYKDVARVILNVARSGGRITAEVATDIEEMLERSHR